MERDWNKDMEGCKGLPPTPWTWEENETGEWFKDANGNTVIGGEGSFWDWVGGNIKVEKLFRFLLNSPEALPYWMKAYAAEANEVSYWKGEAESARETIAHLEAENKRLSSLLPVLREATDELIKAGTEMTLHVPIPGSQNALNLIHGWLLNNPPMQK